MLFSTSRASTTIATSTADCREVFVYFKHEDQGKGPELARLLIEALTERFP